ncbi:hypothetical protein L6452_03362 [Arctium lappa]|uniref:Uncharacterized protein n=1 Tax=Arctium lappa TaxID=4217 RepID=A0ACB9FN80_ARCLA|nr:hypothetical protein L6452_03362 [Arctium lappa]
MSPSSRAQAIARGQREMVENMPETSSNHIASTKFSSKPEVLDKSSKNDGGGDDRRDGWWKKFTGSSDSESIRVTSSSNGENTDTQNRVI